MAIALIDTAHRAGKAALRYYNENIEVAYKADNSPVTAADRRPKTSSWPIWRGWRPDLPVIAEEQAAAGILPLTERRFFVVDPLDGTKEFIKRNGEFTVNIALVEDGVPRLGVIYAPALGLLYFTLSETEAFAAHLDAAADGGGRARRPGADAFADPRASPGPSGRRGQPLPRQRGHRGVSGPATRSPRPRAAARR